MFFFFNNFLDIAFNTDIWFPFRFAFFDVGFVQQASNSFIEPREYFWLEKEASLLYNAEIKLK